MKANQIRQTVFPLLTAFIWGTSFVAQSVSTDHIGPFTFNDGNCSWEGFAAVLR